jgi:hypothetical protein
MPTRTAHLARRRLPAIAAAAAAALLAGASPAAAQARAFVGSPTAAGGGWGKAIEVPGTAALNTGGNSGAGFGPVSCPSAGNCSAGGFYTDSTNSQQVFVVGEVHGSWGKAKEIPGTAALNTGGSAVVNSVSCASAGNCAAGGYYTVGRGDLQAFVVSEVHGTWGPAEEVPGTAALNQGGGAGVNSVSCPSAGNCSAGGFYKESSAGGFFTQAFVVSEVHGTWGKAREVPGTDARNTGGLAVVNSVSCASVGNCSAGGSYTDSSGNQQAFVVTQTNGTWGTAKEVPGTAALNQGGTAAVTSVSCASAGTCSAGGYYDDSSGVVQMLVVSQVNGTWGNAREIPGTAALNQTNRVVQNVFVSCASAGNCSVGGVYQDSSGHVQAFVVSQVNGMWGTAEEIPGTAALNAGGAAYVNAVSCASAGNCDAGGNYTDSSGNQQAFVVSQVHGTWGTAEEVRGTAALNTGGLAGTGTLSCAPEGTCSAGGGYLGTGGFQAFVVNKT